MLDVDNDSASESDDSAGESFQSPPLTPDGEDDLGTLDEIYVEGNITIKVKTLAGEEGPFRTRQCCVLRGNTFQSFYNAEDEKELQESFTIVGVRCWEDVFANEYKRGLIIDTESGDMVLCYFQTERERDDWMQVLLHVADILERMDLPRFGGGSDSEGEDGDGAVEQALRKQRDNLLRPMELEGSSLIIFQVDCAELRRIPGTFGSDVAFNNGDTYVILHARETESSQEGDVTGVHRTLHYWIGSKAPSDKATVACIKAVELRRALGGKCDIQREDEGQEAPEFIVLFGDIIVEDGQETQRVLQAPVLENEPIMYRVVSTTGAGESQWPAPSQIRSSIPLLAKRDWKAKSSFTTQRVVFSRDQLASDSIFLLDGRQGIIYLWRGSQTTWKLKTNGLEAATCLKGDAPKGAKVIVVEEGNEPQDWIDLIATAQAAEAAAPTVKNMPGSLSGLRVLFRVTCPAPEAPEEPRLYLINCNNLAYLKHVVRKGLPPEEEGVPVLSTLVSHQDASYILDCFSEVFVWHGGASNGNSNSNSRLAAAKMATRLAGDLLRASIGRPQWANEIVHVREGQEPFVFRSKFRDWAMQKRTHQSLSMPCTFFDSVRTTARTVSVPRDQVARAVAEHLLTSVSETLETPEEFAVKEAGAGDDEGLGELIGWRISQARPRGVVFIQDRFLGHFSSSSSYVLLYGFTDKVADADESDNSSLGHDADHESVSSVSSSSRDSKGMGEDGILHDPHPDGGSLDSEDGAGSDIDRAHCKYIVYFWQGDRARKSDWVHWQMVGSKTLMPEWRRTMGDIKLIRVHQGREPSHFRRMFSVGARPLGQRLVVHERQWRRVLNPEWRVSLFKVQSTACGNSQTFQVSPCVSSLSSKEVFVCIRSMRLETEGLQADAAHDCGEQARVWYWQGRYVNAALQEQGATVLMNLIHYHGLPVDMDISILDETCLMTDSISQWEDMAENALGGGTRDQYASWEGPPPSFPVDYDVDDDPFAQTVPRLYLLDTRSGQPELAANCSVRQEDLTSDTLAVLVAPECVYIWKGGDANSEHYATIYKAARLFAKARGKARAIDELASSGGLESAQYAADGDNKPLQEECSPSPKRGPGRFERSTSEFTVFSSSSSEEGSSSFSDAALSPSPGSVGSHRLGGLFPAHVDGEASRMRYSVKEVAAGREPLEFQAYFQNWDDALDVGFADVYEKRLEQRAREHTLGDASQLRGRVLADDEARRYWSEQKRQAGQLLASAGVGPFCAADLAARVALRRGVPQPLGDSLGSARGEPAPLVEAPPQQSKNLIESLIEGFTLGTFWGSNREKEQKEEKSVKKDVENHVSFDPSISGTMKVASDAYRLPAFPSEKNIDVSDENWLEAFDMDRLPVAYRRELEGAISQMYLEPSIPCRAVKAVEPLSLSSAINMTRRVTTIAGLNEDQQSVLSATLTPRQRVSDADMDLVVEGADQRPVDAQWANQGRVDAVLADFVGRLSQQHPRRYLGRAIS